MELLALNTTSKNSRNKIGGERVAIQQHFLSHYREPIFNLLCRQKSPNPEYVLFADTVNNEQIKSIDFAKASISPEKGGMRWKRIRNIWFAKFFLFQPAVVSLGLDKRYDCIIYLGVMYHLYGNRSREMLLARGVEAMGVKRVLKDFNGVK